MAQVVRNLWMVVKPTKSRDPIGLGHHAGGALDVLAAQLDALPVADVLDPTVEGKGLPVDGQQVVAPIAPREAHLQVVEVLLAVAGQRLPLPGNQQGEVHFEVILQFVCKTQFGVGGTGID